MTAAWAAVAVTGIAAVFTGAAVLIRTGRHAGKLESLLEQLVKIDADHEARIRKLENPPRKR